MPPTRRGALTAGLACTCSATLYAREATADAPAGAPLERPAAGTPHRGKVLPAVQAHSDDVPLTAAGVVAWLVTEGYTGCPLRATTDDTGDAPGLGTPGAVGDHVLGNERDNAEVARVLGLKTVSDLNYPNHRMGDTPRNELICRVILLVRLLRVDAVVCRGPWAHDEENPDHVRIARGVEAAGEPGGVGAQSAQDRPADQQPHQRRGRLLAQLRPHRGEVRRDRLPGRPGRRRRPGRPARARRGPPGRRAGRPARGAPPGRAAGPVRPTRHPGSRGRSGPAAPAGTPGPRPPSPRSRCPSSPPVRSRCRTRLSLHSPRSCWW